MPNILDSLVGELLNKTEQKLLDWKPTGTVRQYALSLRKGTVVLDEWAEKPNGTFYSIRILSKDGSDVEKLEIRKNQKDYDAAKRLFETISRTFKEKIVEDILSELQTK